MSRMEWNRPGERFFEAGVDRGVLYPKFSAGVPWNGLIRVNESQTGGSLEALYYDGVKYLDLMSGEDFTATIDAYSAPPEFAPSDGLKSLAPGLYATHQRKSTFGFSYRTGIGNDLVGMEHGYKIHLVYNCMASSQGRNYQTVTNEATANARSWNISTIPPLVSTFQPTAHLVVDSTTALPNGLSALENALYGTEMDDPYLPSIPDIIDFLTAVE